MNQGNRKRTYSLAEEPDKVLGFGEGRAKRMIYYQYENAQRRRTSVHDVEEKNADVVNIDVGFDSNEWNSGFSFRRLWAFTGPGWLMSIAYLDPGNLESDLQGGAQAGYQLIWVLWWATFAGWMMQTLAARLGTVTGRHLAEVARTEYSTPIALLLWVFTELAIIGSDIQEIVGSAFAMKLLFGWSLVAGCIFTAVDTFTFMLIHYFGIRKLEFLFAVLISIMAVTFGVNFFQSDPDYLEILKGWVVPQCESTETANFAVGMIGAVIMPHNLFLHSALVHSREIDRERKEAVSEANYYFAIEGAISLLMSFFINLFVVVVFAVGFYKNPKYDKDAIGLSVAGDLLGDEFGSAIRIIWGIGLLAAGQSSTMTGTFAGQYVMQGFLDIHWAPWKRTMMTRSIALVPALLVATLFNAPTTLDVMNQWLNIQQSVQLPFALIPLLVFCCDKRIMGEFALVGWKRWFFWTISAGVIGVNIYIIWTFADAADVSAVTKWSAFGVFMALYVGFCGYLVYDYLVNVVKLGSGDAESYRPLKDSKKSSSSVAASDPQVQN